MCSGGRWHRGIYERNAEIGTYGAGNIRCNGDLPFGQLRTNGGCCISVMHCYNSHDNAAVFILYVAVSQEKERILGWKNSLMNC